MWYNTKGKGSSDNMDKIIIKGARENNLKNINIEIPKNKLVVMTGVSGSGKSSLAFDTIYAEGQRRYVESLSAYARQFLGSSGKPDVDVIEGLSPSISIDQKTTNKNPRSTVGTVTEIYDYLRLLFARVGVPHCPNHHIPISSQSIEEMTNKILELEENTKIMVMSPVVKGEKGTQKDLFEKLRKEGYIRIKVDDEIYASDLREYRDNRIFSIHTQSIDSLENDESRNGLYKKFVTSTTCSMDMSECSRFEWIEEIENSVLYLAISKLAVQQKELLTLLYIDGYSQVEIAEFFHTSKDAINKRFLRINKRITASVAKQGGLYK